VKFPTALDVSRSLRVGFPLTFPISITLFRLGDMLMFRLILEQI
jgi:hypothetical protein